MFFMDQWYIILVLPAIALSLAAQGFVTSSFGKYSRVMTRRGMTGAEAAEAILRQSGVRNVRIEGIAGKLTDHFDPRGNVIRLSESVYGRASVAAVGVAAHEAGHAIQYAENYAPMKVRAAVVPATKFGSSLAFPLILAGLFLEMLGLAYLGVGLFLVIVFFQLVTLPVEFNASRRALAGLQRGGYLSEPELPQARKVLNAAAMTYVAALAVSIMQLLRFIILINGRRR
jgi:hypothetical protein